MVDFEEHVFVFNDLLNIQNTCRFLFKTTKLFISRTFPFLSREYLENVTNFLGSAKRHRSQNFKFRKSFSRLHKDYKMFFLVAQNKNNSLRNAVAS